MNTLDLFMQTVPDGSSFKYRMTCLATGDQIIKQSQVHKSAVQEHESHSQVCGEIELFSLQPVHSTLNKDLSSHLQ